MQSKGYRNRDRAASVESARREAGGRSSWVCDRSGQEESEKTSNDRDESSTSGM